MWRVVDPQQHIGMHSHQPHEQQGLAQVLILDLSMPLMSPKEDGADLHSLHGSPFISGLVKKDATGLN